MRRALPFTLLALGTGCFGAAQQQRSYYVLHGTPQVVKEKAPIPGLVRVRNLDPASAYDKFQIVVRKSPFELRYSEGHVWAVKPNRMLSDIIARALAETDTFAAVTRELGTTRPRYSLDGDLESIEIYDSDDLWFGHLAVRLRLTNFATGEVLWTFAFDERKQVHSTTYSHAARTLSELLSAALERAIESMAPLQPGWTEDALFPDPQPEPDTERPEPVLVPEPPPPEPKRESEPKAEASGAASE